MIQLILEYDPAPPFSAGSPQSAAPETLAKLRDLTAGAREQRQAAIERAARRLATAQV
ncbi:hypothetical protein BJ122_10682 [Rhodopseudomonas faecalis]|uniref:Uncharacterized protein n=1 Tax=Rhodopseudomonas faecalis TaxID=99655 RepID=A0A318TFA8_9BRAD|nr:hypothetical protein [Rhodopseudomonas faecalis]PYF03591.1 hypothetical protein BJ122_10682 [Rhodopseudomonas faecalis]